MKELIQTEITYQKFVIPPNKKYIQRLQQMLSKSRFDIKDFIDTGVITTTEDFCNSLDTPPLLHKKCTDVIRYIGDNYIQLLSNGDYLGRGKRSKKLEKIEKIIFKLIQSHEQ